MVDPLISIVTGTYNRKPHLIEMVESVRAELSSISYEIILVDGGSTDGTLEWAESQKDCTLVRHGELKGAIRAFTDGGNLARGKYTLFGNDDVTFPQGSILRALAYLENTLRCGAVAFDDTRNVGYHPAQLNGRQTFVRYCQVGLVRTFLGNHVGWWGADKDMATGRTYAGDNWMSAQIWQAGYTIDGVEGCKINDKILDDELRAINNQLINGAHPDSELYYSLYPVGHPIIEEPQIPNEHKRQLRILYAPIYEPGHEVQKANKRGLREAMEARGFIVYELDYMAQEYPGRVLVDIAKSFQPDMVLLQCHDGDRITADHLAELRGWLPHVVILNWNGDPHMHSLTGDKVLKLLRYVDLQLVVNAAPLNYYAEHGFNAAYWQIGIERPLTKLPKMPQHDIVFLANNNGMPSRHRLIDYLRGLRGEFDVGIYGSGWNDASGENLYDFATAEALYKSAKVAIGDSPYPDTLGFVSNRFFQIMASGGAILLQEHMEQLDDYNSGIIKGVHYMMWNGNDELDKFIRHYLEETDERKIIAKTAYEWVHQFGTFEARLTELFDGETPLLTKTGRGLEPTITLQYTGRNKEQFGMIGAASGKHYLVNPGNLLQIDVRDIRQFLSDKFVKVG